VPAACLRPSHASTPALSTPASSLMGLASSSQVCGSVRNTPPAIASLKCSRGVLGTRHVEPLDHLQHFSAGSNPLRQHSVSWISPSGPGTPAATYGATMAFCAVLSWLLYWQPPSA